MTLSSPKNSWLHLNFYLIIFFPKNIDISSLLCSVYQINPFTILYLLNWDILFANLGFNLNNVSLINFVIFDPKVLFLPSKTLGSALVKNTLPQRTFATILPFQLLIC